jgi:sugar lactone lactonase YvrE
MMFTLRRGCLGPLRKPVAAVCSLTAWLVLALAGQRAAAQLKVGQPIDFGSSAIGSSVTIQVVLSATGATTVSSASVLTNGATGQDFTQVANTCSGTIAQGSSCSVTIAFTPRQIGVRHGVMLLYGSSNQVISTVFLNGIGLGASFAFAPASVTALASAPALTPATFTAGSSKQDGNGNLYFTDVQNQRILERNASTSVISQVASLPVSASSSIAIGPDGTLFVSAQSSVYAFLPGATPTAISTGSISLVSPSGVAVDSIGNLFIADAATGKIVEYSLETNTSTLVNLSPLGVAGLSNPHGLALDAGNNLYISDSGNDRIVEVSSGDSSISLLVLNGVTLNDPTGIAVDPAGTIYVTDTGNSRLVELTVNGVDFVLTDTNLSLSIPTGVLIEPSGDLIISDQALGLVSVLRSTPKVNFPTPTVVGFLDTTDGALTLSVQATGNSVAQLVYPSSGSEPLITTAAFALTSAGSCPYVTPSANYTPEQFAIGAICTYTIDFTPTIVGLNSANLEIDTGLPGSTATFTQLVPLTGQGLSSIVAFSLVASPSSTTVGSSDSLTLTALNSSNNPAKDYVGTVTFTTTDSTGVFLGGTTYTFTATDAGVLIIPAGSGIQFNQPGVFTVHATDGTYAATSNQVTVKYPTNVSSFTSSVNPSLINQQTTLSATITSTSTPIGGSVTFYNGSAPLGTSNVTGGIATLPVSFPTAATYTLTAVYNGDATHAGSTSTTLSQVVLNPTTATSFTSSVNPSLPNENTVLTMTLASSGPAPTGSVSFYNGKTLLGAGNVIAGAASLTVSFPFIGTYGLSAVYSGDGNDATVTATLTQQVVPPVAVILTSSINPSLVNQQVTLSAYVGSPITMLTGSVQFYDGATLLGTVNLSFGAATLATTFTTVGVHTLTAVYSGDPTHVGATSSPYAQDVVTATVAGNLTSSVNPSQVNQNTLLSVSLTATGIFAPTGTVKFYSGTTLLGTGTVNSGVATLTTSFPAAGAFSLTAVYSGDTDNAGVTAGPLTQVVLTPGSVVLTSSVNPSPVGQNTSLTAFLGTTTATGTVSFYDGTTLLATGTVASGQAGITVSFSTVGIHSLTAAYSGDGNNAPATSAILAQDVVTATNITSFTSSVNPSLANQNTTLTLTLASTGGSPAPTGTVKFYNGTALLGTGTVISGVATLATSFPAIGSYPLTAVYSGDNDNATITAGPLTQVVVAPGSVVLTSSINPSLVGQSTNLTAYLGSTTATGMVSFYDGSSFLGTGNVSAGAATLPISFNLAGIHSLTASYPGDANNAKATSAIYSQDVVNQTTVASFTSSVNPSLVGQSTTLSVTLTSSSAIAGTVKFYDGITLLGTVGAAGGTASLPVSFSTAGTHLLTAVYSGDTNNATVIAGPLAQVVLNSTNITLTSSVNPVPVNASTTLTATLGSSLATGSISFYDASTLLGTSNVSGGVATLPAGFSPAGIHTLKAVYSGDAIDAGATSSNYAQDVVTPTVVASFTSSVNPSLVGQNTLLTVTLLPTGTAPVTGTVSFYNGGVLIGAGPVNSGAATLTTSFAALGTYSLTAVYSGDTYNATVSAGPLTQVVVAPGSVVLTSSMDPSLVGQNTSLTAYLGSTTATGTVSFYDGGTLLTTGAVSNGQASIAVSFSAVGIHSLKAVYSGDSNDAAATSAILAQDVVTPTNVTSFTSSVNPSLVNQNTLLTLTLASTGGSPAPTGAVKFYNGVTLLGSNNLTNGVATLSVSFPAIGSYPLTAVYSGDNDSAAITAALTQVVVAPGSAVLTSSVNPSLVGKTTMLSAYVGSITAGGSVSFYDGNALLGTSNVSSGVATFPASFTTAGIHSLTAQYSGDANDAKATSAILAQDVQNPDTTSLSSPAGPVVPGQSITLTATIQSTAPGGAGSATGTVQFYNGGTLIGTGTVSGGVATLTASFTTPGTQTLTCQYSGDNYFAASTCAAFGQVIVNPSSLKLTSSLNPSTFNQSVTFTATVVTAGPTPTGQVSFYNGNALLTTVMLPVNSNTVTYTTSALPIGTDAIKAVYGGDTNTPMATNTLSQVVLNPATIVFNCPASDVIVNTATTLTATVSSTGPAPTGTVKFMDGSTLLGTGTISGGIATISATFPTIGPQTLTAIYSGDSNDGTVTSTACTAQVVDAATIALTSSVNPSVVQQSVTFTATIGSSGPTPTGSVKFMSGATLLGTGNVINGVASLPYTFATQGTYSITTVYSGDGNTAPVTSSPLSQLVLNVATVTLTSLTGTILLDNQDVLSVTIASTGVTPTGLVTFFDGTAPLGNATLVNGTATITVSFPVTGLQSLTAQYYGDAVTAPAASPALSETVGDISVAVASGKSSTATVLAGGTATYSLVLTPRITSTLPSTVGFSVSGLPTGATATFTPASAAAGSGATPFTLTINVPAITAQLHNAPPHSSRLAPIAAALLLLPLAFAGRRRLTGTRRSLSALLLLLLLAAGAAGLTGCITSANSGYYGQTVQTYNLTVIATSGQLSRTTGLTLTVQ